MEQGISAQEQGICLQEQGIELRTVQFDFQICFDRRAGKVIGR
jgi:hypothetical protein